MRVRELAESLNVTVDTVRYYTRVGFLRPQKDSGNGYKQYSHKDQQRLRFILSARHLGFSVKDVGLMLEEADKGVAVCSLVRRLIEKRLEETEEQFQQTLALRERMKTAINEWQDKPDQAPTGHMICHLIEEFGN